MRKTVILLLAIFLSFNLFAQNYPQQPKDIIGIGKDYTWTTGNKEAFIRMLSVCRLNTTSIELAGWGNSYTKKGQLFLYRDGIEAIRPHYQELLSLCRKYNILLIVSILNDNKGLGKYGDDYKTLFHYKKEADDALNMVLSYGPEGIWVQVVAETQTPYGLQLEEKWIPIFKNAGFKVIYNRGSRPFSPQYGADFFAYHNCNLNDYGIRGCILIPDCGKAIESYTNGGINGKYLKPDVLYNLSKNTRKFGDRGLCVYTSWSLENVKYIDALAISFGWGNWRFK